MPEIQASRRLVKSPPELWAEVSDAASLARHLGEVGEITITRLEPETTVAWEGERASGTVELAPAGWGTSVTLTAEPVAAADEPPAPEPAPESVEVAEPEEPVATAEPEPEPAATAEPEPPSQPEPAADATPVRRSWLARLFGRTPKPPAAPEPQPSATDADRAGGSEDARPPAEGPVGAHPEGHRPRSGWSGPARQAAEPEHEEPTAAEPQHEASAAEEPQPAPDPLESVLTHALDSLGQAHHRPFSRG
jgi:hypothetical protein